MTGLGFFYGPFIPYLAMEGIVIALLVIATIGVLRMPYYKKKGKEFLPLDKHESHPVVELETTHSESHLNDTELTK